MKKKIYLIIPLIVMSVGCTNQAAPKNEEKEKTDDRIPINYDYKNLKLHLNTPFDDTAANVEWRWDYMTSENGLPDTTGIDHYMNMDEPSFMYNGQETQPALFITTDKKKIIAFSVTVLFNEPDRDPESMLNLLGSLTKFDLLESTDIKQTLVNDRFYNNVQAEYEEEITLTLIDELAGYDRITYSIKNRTEKRLK